MRGEDLPLTLLIRSLLGHLCTIALSRIGCIRPQDSNLQLCVYSVSADRIRSSDAPMESLLLYLLLSSFREFVYKEVVTQVTR